MHSITGRRAVLSALVVFAVFVATLAAQRPAAPPTRPAPKAAPAARTERPVPFRAGETLSFDVSWSSYLTAGNATVTVREKKPSFGSTAYYIVAEGRPTPLLSRLYTLYYKADTLLDSYTLLPQRGSVYSEEGRRRRTKITRFDQAAHKAQFEMQTTTVMRKDLTIPAFAQDALSAMYVLRAVPLKQGARMTMPVVDNGNIYRVEMAIGGREPVTSGIGTVSCWRITPTARDQRGANEGSRLTLWLTDDARRLPVKMEAELAVGKFVLTLKNARG